MNYSLTRVRWLVSRRSGSFGFGAGRQSSKGFEPSGVSTSKAFRVIEIRV